MNKRVIDIEVSRIGRMVKHGFPLSKLVAYRLDNAGFLELKKGYPLSGYVNEYQASNAFYGHSSVLKYYSKFNGVCPSSIEHGVYLGGCNFSELYRYNLPSVFTFSDARAKEIFESTGKPAFAIGPYISYAKPYLKPEEHELAKRKLGRTALVFPVHTVERTSVEYDANEFISFIINSSKKLSLDTILVSSYFLDIEENKALFENNGMKVVCSGSRLDRLFLSRLRSYFELSDYVFTNSVGTHIGYSVAMNKPCSIFCQNMVKGFDNIAARKWSSPNEGSKRLADDKASVVKAFAGLNLEITGRQRSVADNLFGVSLHREPQFIKEALSLSRLALFGTRREREVANDRLLKLMNEAR